MNERDEEKLREEQEEILFMLSQIMPESSQETIFTPEDLEEMAKNENICLGRNSYCTRDDQTDLVENEEIASISGDREKKHREVTSKCWRNSTHSAKNELGDVKEDDSGFATSSEQLLRVASLENSKQDIKPYNEEEMGSDPSYSDSEDSCNSVESVSLLQTASFISRREKSENKESCVNIAWNIKLFPSLPDDEDEMQVDEEQAHLADKSVQTYRILTQAEEHIKKSADFISSFHQLKYIFLSKKNLPAKKYLEILNNTKKAKEFCLTSLEESCDDSDNMNREEWICQFEEFENFDYPEKSEKRQRDVVPHEVIHYVLRTTNAEDVMQKSIESILVWLKDEMKKNCKYFFQNWHDSVRADSVDIINEVVDLDSGFVRTKVSQFLIEIFDEVNESDSPIEDTILEYKISFLSGFCKSVLLSYDLIDHVSGKLYQFTKPKFGNKLQMITSVKKNYFSLRLLNDLLILFLHHLQTEEFQGIFCRKSNKEELNILNLWKSYWKGMDDSRKTDTRDICMKYVNVIREWCHQTDQVLRFCVEEIPSLLLPANKCSLLAQDILFEVQNAAQTRE